MNLMNAIRAAIADSHEAIEQTGFSKGMMEGWLSRRDYACGLKQLWLVHSVLEEAIVDQTQVTAFFTPEMIRSQAIQEDIVDLGFDLDSFEMLAETKNILDFILDQKTGSPLGLLGCLYILEGSRMGSLVIVGPLRRTLDIPLETTRGLQYHLQDAQNTPSRVRALKEKMNQAGFNETESKQIEMGAVDFMHALYLLYHALSTSPSANRWSQAVQRQAS